MTVDHGIRIFAHNPAQQRLDIAIFLKRRSVMNNTTREIFNFYHLQWTMVKTIITTISMITTSITMTKTTIEIGRRSGRGALLCLYPMDGAVINSPRAHLAHLAQEKSHLASYPHHHPPQQHQCEHQYSDFSDGLRFSL